MTLGEVFGIKFEELSTRKVGMGLWKEKTAESLTGGAMWSGLEAFYWSVDEDYDLNDLVMLNQAKVCPPTDLHYVYLQILPDVAHCLSYFAKCTSNPPILAVRFNFQPTRHALQPFVSLQSWPPQSTTHDLTHLPHPSLQISCTPEPHACLSQIEAMPEMFNTFEKSFRDAPKGATAAEVLPALPAPQSLDKTLTAPSGAATPAPSVTSPEMKPHRVPG
jgi:hypothetical protein